jgi:hypothetical protein
VFSKIKLICIGVKTQGRRKMRRRKVKCEGFRETKFSM